MTPEMKKRIDAWAKAAAVKRKELTEALSLLGAAGTVVCQHTCQTTWKTGEPQPHADLCRRIHEVVERHQERHNALEAAKLADADGPGEDSHYVSGQGYFSY